MPKKFDDFLTKQEIINKHKDLRDYFVNAYTHAELKLAYAEIGEAIKKGEYKKVPDEVLDFFYEERKKQLGADIKVNAEIKHAPDAIDANIQRAMVAQNNSGIKNRPTDS